jgi:hypothetical protein
MHRILITLILPWVIFSADSITVNLNVYENRTISLCDESLHCGPDEYRSIGIRGYGSLHVSLSEQCTSKPTYGIFRGQTYGLTINLSDTMYYDTLGEDWRTDSLPDGLVKVTSSDDFLTEVSNFGGIEHCPVVGTVTKQPSGIIILPVHESGNWEDPMNGGWSNWFNSFGNIGEIFYISRERENTIKFQIVETSTMIKYSINIATDDRGNGKFKCGGTPVVQKDLKNHSSQTYKIRCFNNRLFLPAILRAKEISIYNFRGQKVLSQMLESNTISIKNLSSGVYHYVITREDGMIRGTFLKSVGR